MWNAIAVVELAIDGITGDQVYVEQARDEHQAVHIVSLFMDLDDLDDDDDDTLFFISED